MPSAILVVVVIAIGVVVFGKPRNDLAISTSAGMSAGERVSWLFLLVPLTAYILGHLVTHIFHDRYSIGAVPGIVVGATCLLWRYCREWKYLSAALLLAFGGYAVTQQVLTLRNIDHIRSDTKDYQQRTKEVLSMEDALVREKQHLVLSLDVEYLEVWYYSKHRAQYECFTPEQRWTIKKYVPLKFVSLEEIVANAPQTVLVTPSTDLIQALKRAGVHLKVHFVQPQYYPVNYLE